MTHLRSILIAFALLGIAGSSVHAQTAPAPTTLRPGDRVAIAVWRNAELSGTFPVGDDGTLMHPLYGELTVTDLPIPVVRQRIRELVREYESDPRITIIPEYRIFVGGAVGNPNQHYLPEMSVGQAIIMAGGSTAPERRHRVRFIRAGTERVENLNSPRISALLQTPVLSGDQIVVEERPTIGRTFVTPALQAVQAVAAVLTTYFLLDRAISSDE